ncbi:hypothetical protein [Paraburkholderia dipogonis]|uniref:hypothetical protein n=1 Tax=Paraburkholderia dipogonis TaxID=1211383 RepID=UPI00366B3F83
MDREAVLHARRLHDWQARGAVLLAALNHARAGPDARADESARFCIKRTRFRRIDDLQVHVFKRKTKTNRQI